jgi:predicted DCC family thiol-disulfide oxidoreductase YuxK
LDPSESSEPVILFDGVCNLCNGAVAWIVRRDRSGRFRFASLQSDAARKVLAGLDLPDGLDLAGRVDSAEGLDPARGMASLRDTVVLVDGAGVHVESTAVLRIARGLGFPHALWGSVRVIPRPLRDAVYRFVARNRYRWFGRTEACARPTDEVASRFLDAEEYPIGG